jgi:hypothetical protein
MHWEWQLFSTPWHVISAALVFLLGAVIAIRTGKSFGSRPRRAMALFCWHTVFCVFYAYYMRDNIGDARGYFHRAMQGDVSFALGTAAVDLITQFCVSILHLSFLGAFLVFNIFGAIGLLAFDASLRFATVGKSNMWRAVATLIVLLPSVNFWSSAIGKDSIAFMSTGLALWAALELKRRTWLMVAAVALMLLVRPHIAGIMIAALAGSQLLQRRISLAQRVLLGGAATLGAAFLVPLALDYTGLGADLTAQDLSSYIEQRQQMNREGAASLDIASMGTGMRLFTLMFRPLPLEANTLFSLAASLDNVVLLLVFSAGLWQLLRRHHAPLPGNRAFMWLYSLMVWVLLASTVANLGIAARQKWMFIPMLAFLLISVLGKTRRPRPQLKGGLVLRAH